jgi:hypothetical protein
LDGLIQNRARIAGIVGVVQVDGGLRGRGRRRRGLGAAEDAQQQNGKQTIHGYWLEAVKPILAVPF